MNSLSQRYRQPKALLIALIIFATLIPIMPSQIKPLSAEATGSWTTTTNYPVATDGQSCVSALISGAGYLYCTGGNIIGGGTSNSYYVGALTTGLSVTWLPTTAFPVSLPFPSCFTYYLADFCIYAGTNTLYAAGLSSSGIGPWAQQTPLPAPYVWGPQPSQNNNCAEWNSYVYCIAYNGGGSDPIIFSNTVSISGIGGFWSDEGDISGAGGLHLSLGVSCEAVQTTGTIVYLVCVGGRNTSPSPTSGVYYAQINNGAVGTWHTGTNYPESVQWVNCWSANAGYLNCLGGQATHAYYATVSTGGTIAWTQTTTYSNVNVAMQSCQFIIQSGLEYLYCTWGLNEVAGGFTQIMEFSSAAAIGSSIFTAIVTNFDAGNFLIAGSGAGGGGKYYDFRATVTSAAIASPNAQISNVTLWFNDTTHIITMSYNNATNTFLLSPKSTSYARLSSSSTAVSSYNGGNREIVVDFLLSVSNAIFDASNRDLTLFALNANLISKVQVVQENYLNIMHQGGGGTVSVLSSGGCGIYSGSDTFQTACHYGANAKNWIATNATYQDLQSYQANFFIELDNQTSAGPTFTATSPQLGYFFQNYGNSGAGTNPSSNKGDWKLNYGLYYYDNSTWVKGLNVVLQMQNGRVGSANLWTGIQALWYNGKSTLIANQTIYAFVPQIPNSQVGLWINLWYSQNNASTVQGGQISSVYTGMHNTGFLIWSSWSPFLGNQTQSQVFAPIKDHNGNLMSVSNAQFSKVFTNMSRTGAPLANAKQWNFQIQTVNFQEQEFNTASSTPLLGVTTPTFTSAIVPTISSGSIFSPIINAIKQIANFFIKGLASLGNMVWAGLQAQFPWFTNFWSSIGSIVVDYVLLLASAIQNLLGILSFMVSHASVITTPIAIITGTWTQLQALLGWLGYLPTGQIPVLIELYVTIFFGLSMFEAFITGDWPFIIRFTKNVWNVANSIFQWTWYIVKLFIDTIEGLIP